MRGVLEECKPGGMQTVAQIFFYSHGSSICRTLNNFTSIYSYIFKHNAEFFSPNIIWDGVYIQYSHLMRNQRLFTCSSEEETRCSDQNIEFTVCDS